ncbi:MAG: sensor histidine kinase [Bacteroidales bacterium]|nr:sensor histidine kinase [Bacteroidales bacterium]
MNRRLLFILLIGLPATIIYAGNRLPVAQQGVLDLRNTEKKTAIHTLNGEWEFYWKTFLLPGQFDEDVTPDTYGKVPSYWTSYKEEIEDVTGFGYGTYRLRILLPKDFPDSLSLQIPVFDSSYELFLNGSYICGNGKTGRSKQLEEPEYQPYIYSFFNSADTLEIVIQVSNFSHRRGGFWMNMNLGQTDHVLKKNETKKVFNYGLNGILLGTFVLFFAFYFMERENHAFLFFALTTLGVFLRIFHTGFFPVHFLFDQSWSLTVKMEYIGLYSALTFGVFYLNELFPSKFMKKMAIANALFFLAASIMVLISPPYVFSYAIYVLYSSVLFFLAYYIYRSFLGTLKKKGEDTVMFFSFSLFLLTVINDILVAQSVHPLNAPYLMPVGFLLFIGIQVLLLMTQWTYNYRQRTIMHEELQHVNLNLESIIDKRTQDLNKTNNELRNALEMKNRVFSIIAHDLKSPIASLAQYSDLMVEEFGNEKNAEIIHELRKLSYSSVDLIENLLHWGMKQEDHIQYHAEIVSIAEIVNELYDLFYPSFKNKSITFKQHINEQLTGYCDKSLLKIILRNLLNNAIKFTRQNGSVTITAEKTGSEITITLSDTGIGMEKEIIENILNNHVESTRGTAGEKGTGLGLSVVRDLVKINNGTLRIESKPGSGTSVTFSLPGKP